jgi:hypothetical protein
MSIIAVSLLEDYEMRRTVTIKLGVWYDADEQRIKLTSRDFISSVDLNPASTRHHPHLLRKLARLLRANGAPAPEVAP